MSEAKIFATLDYESRMMDADSLAYPPVVAAGDNANIIHYTRYSKEPIDKKVNLKYLVMPRPSIGPKICWYQKLMYILCHTKNNFHSVYFIFVPAQNVLKRQYLNVIKFLDWLKMF